MSDHENPGPSSAPAPVSGDEEIEMDAFKVWCASQGLKQETIAALYDQGFDSARALSLLTEEDITDLNLPQKAQTRLLQAAVTTAKAQSQGAPGEPGSCPAPASLTPPIPKDNVVSTSAQPNPLGMTIDALLNQLPAEPNRPQAQFRPELDPTFHLYAGKSGTNNCKPLEVVDFVGMSLKFDQFDEHVISEIGENNGLVLKSSTKKPKYDSLTVWQWCLGAIRIQDELVRVGKLQSEIDKRQYWGYVCKVLELNSRFEWHSVLEYDKEYRSNQARFQFPWGTEIPHLSSVQLKDKKQNFQNNFTKKGKQFTNPTNGKKQGASQLTCRDFNRGKCVHTPCIYQHSCSVQGCGKNHLACKHDSIDSKNV